MKIKILAILPFLLISTLALFGQQKIDVVYLKNGSILRGVIIEHKINDHIKLRTSDGSVFLYQYEEIDKMTIEEQNGRDWEDDKPSYLANNTGQIGLGLLLSSTGSGVAIHYNLSSKTALEANFLYKGILLYCEDCYDDYIIENSFMVTGSINHFFTEYYKQHKRKTKRNGISFKAGSSFGHLRESFLALSWIQENIRDRNQNHSFFFELGGGLIKLSPFNEIVVYPSGGDVSFLLNIKVHWNWYFASR